MHDKSMHLLWKKARRMAGFFLLLGTSHWALLSCTLYTETVQHTELVLQVRPRTTRYKWHNQPFTGFVTTDSSKFRVKEGLKHGAERVTFPSGDLRHETYWREGRKNGTEFIYSSEGEILARVKWIKGRRKESKR